MWGVLSAVDVADMSFFDSSAFLITAERQQREPAHDHQPVDHQRADVRACGAIASVNEHVPDMAVEITAASATTVTAPNLAAVHCYPESRYPRQHLDRQQ